jgi:mannose-6-phosphate isomerase-like protein (cupin superfamily)
MDESPSSRLLAAHANYERLSQISHDSHLRGRTASGIRREDISLARLYTYAFRLHVIGAFHATKVALEKLPGQSAIVQLQIQRAMEALTDLANRGMDAVEVDERALISSFHFYDSLVRRTIDALGAACEQVHVGELETIRERFIQHMRTIASSNGIHLTSDTQAPVQASFVVPNLGITIVPLVYGDHHSWNLAWLDGPRSDVPYHRHQEGVEIHLGYGPLHGYTVFGDSKAEVTEAYAMPIPPETRHGYTNIGSLTHHVPFVFGSQTCSGWGVFLDVEPAPAEWNSLETKPLLSASLNGTIQLDREIESAASKLHAVRYAIIPAKATDRGRTGGLELSISRVTTRGSWLNFDRFCAVSVVRGNGLVRMAGEERRIAPRDHFGIPSGLPAEVIATEGEPLVLLDAILKPANNR